MEEWVSEGVREFRVCGLAIRFCAFVNTLKQVAEFRGFFCQSMQFITVAKQTRHHLEPVATFVCFFYCYRDFVDKIITTFRPVCFVIVSSY